LTSFSIATVSVATTFDGQSAAYYEMFDITTGTYGNGRYEAYFSSKASAGITSLVDFSTRDVHSWDYTYSSSNGQYSGTKYLSSGYLGEWFVFKFPAAIKLAGFNTWLDYYDESSKKFGPAEFKVYGNTDAIAFNEIIIASTSTKLTTADYVACPRPYTVIYTITFSATATSYQFIGFVVNKVIGPVINLRLGKIAFFKQGLAVIVPASPGFANDCPAGSTASTLCPACSYCPNASSTFPCPASNNSPNGRPCSTCGAGQYVASACNSKAYTSLISCPLNSYCLEGAAQPVACTVCTTGQEMQTACNATQNAVCSVCPVGYVCPTLSHKAMCDSGREGGREGGREAVRE
jgi:hypothetical protein